ncbi:hypothetical protein [Leucobacter ruminantium]|uniref:Uncharacterized protein n=1 Tax=Leucobacter ruminantium TaxID=1289170 RepID=A0A939LXA4_9MICO|nr:hypothetical protein [Leucobacter ruminantium]MBO1806479.1 hypothetical protein [Leucobacter ruminantium]
MKRLFAKAADWAVRNRSRMPRWMGRAMESAARDPDGLVGRISARLLGGGASANTEVPDAELRVYIAPTNYSGQGFLWARALEQADARIAARNCAVHLPGGYAFPADTPVSIATVNASAEWAEAEWQAAKRFTHVLVEAERPMFGKRFGRDLEAEVRALEAEGLSVAFICHGTDIRDPERHAALTPWSPYPEDPRTADLQSDARENAALLERMGRPVFVSTPDLLIDVPDATWCPVVVDAERFATDAPLLPAARSSRPRVIHASSNHLQKGSGSIELALAPLIASGALEYELIGSTPSAEMPGVFAGADIVLDQFRLGSYGVAACEAMAAGRVVVGHVLPQVRETVERDAGFALPIVEATPDTLHDVVAELIADPARMRGLAAAGPRFVARMHTGEASARALTSRWIRA